MTVALARISATELSLDAHVAAVSGPSDGAVATFIGQVRDHDPSVEGTVTHLEYSAHPDAGQIIARILRAKRIPFTALEMDPQQIELVKRFGSEAYFGDPSRPDILAAAEAHKARAFVLAMNDVDASLRTARIVRAQYPKLKVYARARDRNHVHQLMDLGVEVIHRETFASALELSRELLRGLGESERDVRFAIETFREHDERRLINDYAHYTDEQKLRDLARGDAENLAKLFDEDAMTQAQIASADRDRDGGG